MRQAAANKKGNIQLDNEMFGYLLKGVGGVHARVAGCAAPLSGLRLQGPKVGLLLVLNLRDATPLDNGRDALHVLYLRIAVGLIHFLIFQLARHRQVASAASDQARPVEGGPEAVLLLLELLQGYIPAGLVDAGETDRAGIACTRVYELPALLLGVADGAPIGVLPLLAHHKLAVTILQLCQLPVLIRDVDIMLHVLVLEQELALTVEVGLYRLGQVQRDELVRLDLLCVPLTCALNRYYSGPFCPRVELHALGRGLCNEPQSWATRSHASHRLGMVLGERDRIVGALCTVPHRLLREHLLLLRLQLRNVVGVVPDLRELVQPRASTLVRLYLYRGRLTIVQICVLNVN